MKNGGVVAFAAMSTNLATLYGTLTAPDLSQFGTLLTFRKLCYRQELVSALTSY